MANRILDAPRNVSIDVSSKILPGVLNENIFLSSFPRHRPYLRGIRAFSI